MLNLYIYRLLLATVIIFMEMFSIQCKERKENTKRKHKINTVVGGFVVFIATLSESFYKVLPCRFLINKKIPVNTKVFYAVHIVEYLQYVDKCKARNQSFAQGRALRKT